MFVRRDRVTFTGKVEGGIQLEEAMTPAGFYADACTDMSVSVKRQDKRRFSSTDHPIGIESNLEFPPH